MMIERYLHSGRYIHTHFMYKIERLTLNISEFFGRLHHTFPQPDSETEQEIARRKEEELRKLKEQEELRKLKEQQELEEQLKLDKTHAGTKRTSGGDTFSIV